jgi:hypothetical protein
LLAITVRKVEEVRTRTGVDIYALAADGLRPLGELLQDPVKTAEVICRLARNAQGQPPPSDEDFCEAIDGDALERMTTAFAEAVVDFSPSAQRGALRGVMEKGKLLETKLQEHNQRKLAELDPAALATELIAQAEARAQSGKSSSTSPPASPALTPDP